MRRRPTLSVAAALLLAAAVTAGAAGCGDGDAAAGGRLDVLASATFLADIAQNVAGERFTVRSLVPPDADLHAYEPTPRDLAEVAGADLLVVNGAGLEQALEDTVRSSGSDVRVVVASEGLTPRHGDDPHFWLDPVLVKTYVANIRDAFAAADPEGAAVYERNAAAYEAKLDGLDRWIRAQVATVPPGARKLVTNHLSYGYFAARYGFEVVGAVLPGVSTGDVPSARELAELARTVRASGAKAVFVELEADPSLARQIAAETGVTVVADLRDHALSGPEGEAPTYIAMMKYDTRRIVEALR